MLLLDEPLAGLAAAERERVGALIKRISADMPVLLVEHDIDRVFPLADHVTVMNEGQVLVDGTVEDARASPTVQEVYIGSGAHARRREAARDRRPRQRAADARARQHVLRQEPHPARRVASTVHEHEIVALLGPQRRRQVDAAEDDHRHRAGGERHRSSSADARARSAIRRRRSRGAASATCRRAAACSPA